MEFLESIKTSRFGGTAMLNLRDRKYGIVEMSAKERLEQYPDDPTALYMLSLVAYHRDRLEGSFEFYKKMCQTHTVKKKIQRWLTKNLVARQVYSETEYSSAERWCSDLIPLTNFRAIRIELMKYRCACLDKLERFQDVLAICSALRQAGFEDENIVIYEERASRKIKEAGS